MTIASADNHWTSSRFVNEIYNNVMENGQYGIDAIHNEYLDQFENKFQLLVIGSPKVLFEIKYGHLKEETINHINYLIKDCKTANEKYQKLNSIIPDVIAGIAKQVEHRILGKAKSPDPNFLRIELNSVREIVSIPISTSMLNNLS